LGRGTRKVEGIAVGRYSMSVMEKKLKTVPLDTMINRHIGKLGTPDREAFENGLRVEFSGGDEDGDHRDGYCRWSDSEDRAGGWDAGGGG